MNALDTWYAGRPAKAATLAPDPWLTGKDHGRKPPPPRRTPRAQKRVRAEQAELYVQALGLKGACVAMQLGPWQIHSLRRWLRDGAPIPHSRAGRFKPKLTDTQRAEILAAKGKDKMSYLALVHGVHIATIGRIWAEEAAQ